MIDLIAGPWVGEFGWELFGWQGVIRALAPQYDKVTIYGRPGNQYLYEDFMDEYIEHIPEYNEPNMWMNKKCKFTLPKHHKNVCWIKPQQLTGIDNAPEQIIQPYGQQGTNRNIELIYHARDISKYGSDYINWSKDNWEKLLERYSNVICIGTKEGSLYAGGEDMRGASLKETCDLLSQSKVLVGPSSGPMHLGSLCRTPHVVWSGYIRSKDRYETIWNPLGTPVKTMCPASSPWDNGIIWHPEPQDVALEVAKLSCVS